ncbi:MAG: hypothetical protein LBG20_00845 [Holosporaceae bacterium]|jgi:hypothetical protein|nr:hypothetical protein [Holosporaceae bacterium]
MKKISICLLIGILSEARAMQQGQLQEAAVNRPQMQPVAQLPLDGIAAVHQENADPEQQALNDVRNIIPQFAALPGVGNQEVVDNVNRFIAAQIPNLSREDYQELVHYLITGTSPNWFVRGFWNLAHKGCWVLANAALIGCAVIPLAPSNFVGGTERQNILVSIFAMASLFLSRFDRFAASQNTRLQTLFLALAAARNAVQPELPAAPDVVAINEP